MDEDNRRSGGYRGRPQGTSRSAFARSQDRHRWNIMNLRNRERERETSRAGLSRHPIRQRRETLEYDDGSPLPSYGFSGLDNVHGFENSAFEHDPLLHHPSPPQNNWHEEDDSEIPRSNTQASQNREVDHVYHDSPIGPVVSVFPKGCYNHNQQTSMHQYPHQDQHNYHRSSRPCDYQNPCVSGHLSPNTVVDNSIGSLFRTKSDNDSKMVEISPGVRVRLRGAAETQNAIKQGMFVTCSCLSCTLNLHCIMDASYVLCPLCCVVSPVSMCGEQGEGGLGLGVTDEVLEHILSKRNDQQKPRMWECVFKNSE